MENDTIDSQKSSIEPTGLIDEEATFGRLQALLKSKDDTSKFVGLALLKTVLDNGRLVEDTEKVQTLWKAISPKFLDRLLKARQNKKVSKADAKDMVEIAVAILHTFTVFLPEESRVEKRLIGRTAPLTKALIESSSETAELILQTLLTIVSRTEGALELLDIEDVSSLTEISTLHPLALDVLKFAWINASTIDLASERVQKAINEVIPKLLTLFKGTDAVTMIGFTGDLLPKLFPVAIPNDPKWLTGLVSVLRNLIITKPTLAGRTAYTRLASALLQVYPASSPSLLFKDGASGPDSKPFSYLFINLLLIDLRSSFPTLLAKLNSHEYSAISQRLAGAFDVLSSFIGFLVRSLDEDSSSSPFSMPPDLLLKLRKDIAETMSLTIEYLRDRWDASIAGTSGLEYSARSGTAATSEGTRLTLPWDSMKDKVHVDPLMLAGVRGVAIWIREDENENLRNETAGLMDMFVELYKTASEEGLDFRYPILLAIEGIMVTEVGVEGFVKQGGWQAVFEDLESILQAISNPNNMETQFASTEAARGLQIVRVLLAVLDHPSTNFPQEQWMAVVLTAASVKVPSKTPPSLILELQIAMLQLAIALLQKASGGMARRFVATKPALSGLAQQLESFARSMGDVSDRTEFLELLDDVALDLGNLDVR